MGETPLQVMHTARPGLGVWIDEMGQYPYAPSIGVLAILYEGFALEHNDSFPLVYRFPRFDTTSNQRAKEGFVIHGTAASYVKKRHDSN